MPKGYIPNGGPTLGDLFDYVGSQVENLYRSAVDKYNSTVRAVQGYFAGNPMESEYDFQVYSFLDQLGIPRNQIDDLLGYMKRYGLTWDDLNTSKVLQLYGRSSSFRALNFVSRNVSKLYK